MSEDQTAKFAKMLADQMSVPTLPTSVPAYQMDEEGVFVGVTVADPCPLGSGDLLIPAGCVLAAPPNLEKGQIARWTGEAWGVENIPQPPEPEPAPPTPPAAPTMSREAFCVALIDAGILTEAEAVDAALGAWPPKFEPALQGKPLVEQLTIKNLWRETKTVAQDAPLFQDLLAYYSEMMGLTEEQAIQLGDTIFNEN